MENITEKVKYFLEKYDLLNSEKPILVAFSGGYDSMCLLEILTSLRKNIIAIHLNHNWRGDESRLEEEKCRKFCEKKSVKFYSETLLDDIPKTETAAREARYKFFANCAEKFNSEAVLTAHNANDNAETLIYRIAKGTGTTGLCGIAKHRGIYYRPLLEVQRCEIEEFCSKNDLKPNVDSSNDNTKYKRNLIRKNILPELGKINPNVVGILNSLAKNACEDNEIISEYLSALKSPYNTKNFANYSNAVQIRLIYELFRKNDLEYDRSKVRQALDFIEDSQNSKSGKNFSLNQNLFLFVNNEKIEVIQKSKNQHFELEISQEGEYQTDFGTFCIKKYSGEPLTFDENEMLAFVDLKGFQNLKLRTRKDGDTIQPLGCSGKQKLKKYLNEKKVPAHKKAKMLFLAAENEILWAPSLGLSEKIKVVTTPTHVIKFINTKSL